MPDPYAFPLSTPALQLPLLAVGQAQKEFFVNEALSVLDALHPRAIVASQAAPPADAAEGACFRVTAPASGLWSGHEGQIAVRVASDWRFVQPSPGLHLFDQAAGQMIIFRSEWHQAAQLAAPTGGTMIDTEARTAINGLITSLQQMGILPASLV